MWSRVAARFANNADHVRRATRDDTSLGRNFAVGHSYFCELDSRLRENDGEGWDRWYRNIVETEIQPLLEEYWFDDLGKADVEVRKLLGEE